ncbi:MAG TPA: TlpA disulfide reductase family protein [Vicinamibacterales bacterium]|nr:TlpA disulfide reductase family protein [Vicinamibacterales bacterium]
MEQHDQPATTGGDVPSDVSAPRRMRMIAVAATAIALLGISIPFVWQSHDETPAATAATVKPAASHDPAPGESEGAACMAEPKPANWDFKLKDIEGKEVALSSFKDQGKVVLLNFWATWCGPCKAEIPGFIELQEKYRDKLTIIGYSVDDTAELAKKYATEYKMNYPILLGEGREDVQDAYGPIWGIPASFIISKDGKVCRKHMGIAPKAVFEKELIALM